MTNIYDERNPAAVAQAAGATVRVFNCHHGYAGLIAVEASCPNPGFDNEIAIHEHVLLTKDGLPIDEFTKKVLDVARFLVDMIGTRLILRDHGLLDRETGRAPGR